MIPRYTPAEFAALWSSERRYEVWLAVELAACEAMEEAKLVPAGIAARLRAKSLKLDAARAPIAVDGGDRTTANDLSVRRRTG